MRLKRRRFGQRVPPFPPKRCLVNRPGDSRLPPVKNAARLPLGCSTSPGTLSEVPPFIFPSLFAASFLRLPPPPPTFSPPKMPPFPLKLWFRGANPFFSFYQASTSLCETLFSFYRKPSMGSRPCFSRQEGNPLPQVYREDFFSELPSLPDGRPLLFSSKRIFPLAVLFFYGASDSLPFSGLLCRFPRRPPLVQWNGPSLHPPGANKPFSGDETPSFNRFLPTAAGTSA